MMHYVKDAYTNIPLIVSPLVTRSVDYFRDYIAQKKYASEGCTFTNSFSMMTSDEKIRLPGLRRISSQTNLSSQIGRPCYAHAAVNAYRNTLFRIYGLSVPSYEEMLKIAMYSKNGGFVERALKKLEDHYRYGVKWRVTRTKPSIESSLKLSVCVSFATTKKGYNDISKGHHLKKYPGVNNGRHGVLIEGYDFDRRSYVCKNSWGVSQGNRIGGRFITDLDSLRDVHYCEVFFTVNSIRHLKIPVFPKDGIKFRVKYKYKGIEYSAALLTELEGRYNSEFVVIGLAMGYSVAITYPLFEAILSSVHEGKSTVSPVNRILENIIPVKGFGITFEESSY